MNNKKKLILLILLILLIPIKVIGATVEEDSGLYKVFEKIGKYEFVTAGANNIEVTTTPETVTTNVVDATAVTNFNNSLYWNYKDNTTERSPRLVYTPIEARKKVKISTNIATLDALDNISGSKLTFNGEIEAAYLFVAANIDPDIDNFVTIYNSKGKAFDVSKSVYKKSGSTSGSDAADTSCKKPTDEKCNRKIEIYDVTQIVRENGTGWYYVSFKNLDLNGAVNAEYSNWSIVAINKNENFKNKYIRLDVGRGLAGSGKHIDLTLNSKVTFSKTINNTIDIVGVVSDAEPQATMLNDLFLVSNGEQISMKPYFPSRNNQSVGFIYSICDTIRNPEHKNCYELDVFNGKIPTDILKDDKSLTLKLYVPTANAVAVNILGIGVDVDVPSLSMIADISKKDKELNQSVELSNNSEFNACSSKITIPIDSKIKDIKDITITSDSISSDKIIHKYENDKIVVNINEIFKTGDKIKINYKGSHSFTETVILKLEPYVEYYPANGDVCNSNLIIDNLKQIAKDDDSLNVEIVPISVIVPVPDTGKSMIYFIIGGILLVGVGTFIVIKKKIPNKIK